MPLAIRVRSADASRVIPARVPSVFRPGARAWTRGSAVAATRCILGLVACLGTAIEVSAQTRRPGPTRPPARTAPKPTTSPTFAASVSSLDSGSESRAVLGVFSDGDGDVVWGRAEADRAILRLPVRDARVLSGRVSAFARRAIDSRCGTLPETTLPAPLVFNQVRLGVLRTFALGCAVLGDDPGLVFRIADSTATVVGTVGPVLVQPWDVSCTALAAFADSVASALAAGDTTGRPPVLAGACPVVHTAADLRQLATRLLGDGGDSAAVVLADVGPRALAPVVDVALADPYPVARARAARILAHVLQEPLGPTIDPDAYVVVLARRWREERDRGVADTVGRALGALVARNPGRIRTIDTLVQVLRERLPVLAERAKAMTPADVDRGAPEAAALTRALELVAALREGAGGVVATLGDMLSAHGSATDLLVSRTVAELGTLASGVGGELRHLVERPTPTRRGPTTPDTFGEAVAVASSAARALARTGAAGHTDLQALWAAHLASPMLDTTSPPLPPAAAPTDTAKPATPPPDTAALRLAHVWGRAEGRAVPLDYEVRRAALVAGLAAACGADSLAAAPLGLVANEPVEFSLAPPADDAAQRVAGLVAEQRTRSRVAAVDALGDCGPRARSQLDTLFALANAAADDPRVPETVRRAANRAIPRVRRIE